MALAVFVQQGEQIDYTSSADLAAGDVVVQGDLVGIARTPIPANTPGSLAWIHKRKLTFDPVQEEFLGDDEANGLRSPPARAPWTV